MNRPVVFHMLAAALLLALAVPASAEEDEARKRALALQVMEVTGVTSQGDALTSGMIAQIRPVFPTVPEETWKQVALAFDVDQVIELSIPIYTRHFSEEELEQLVEFYESPLGKVMLERMPLILQESWSVLNNWNRQKLTDVVEKLQAQGHEPMRPSEPSGPGSAPPPALAQ